MNNFRRIMFNARPHPNPLSRGEGTGCERLSPFGSAFIKPGRSSSQKTANESPSPGGEGGCFH